MQKPLLTICIPTYNRPDTLAEALESLLHQLNDSVEVFIADDGTNERTEVVVKSYQDKAPGKIRFLKNDRNLGFDGNLLRCIQEARGEYCWFLSDDDQMEANSISSVLNLINSSDRDKFIMANYSKFKGKDKNALPETMIGLKDDQNFKDAADFFFKFTPDSYFKYLGRNLMYMSNEIFRKDQWQKYADECRKRFKGTNFIHTFIFLTILAKEKPEIIYKAESLILYRVDNSRIWPNHIWVTYHTKLLQYAKELGLSKKQITKIQFEYFKTYRKSIISYYFNKLFK